MECEMDGSRPRGRLKRSWREVVQKIVKHVRMLWIVVDGGSW